MDDQHDTSRVAVTIVDGPIGSDANEHVPGAGAVIRFDGVIRPTEDGKILRAIDYSAYQPMAEQQLRSIAQAAMDHHDLLRVTLIHSQGMVPIHAVSLRLIIYAAHRKPAIQAMDEIIDTLKRDVPIWKKLIFDNDKETPH